MLLLAEPEHLILMQFHEQRGDRLGAAVGQELHEDAFRTLEAETPGVDFEGALDSLLARNLLRREGDRYILTQEAYDYMYTREGLLSAARPK